ncbi:MAG: aminoacyl-tRNA hydrolase, partial [Alphaproteobacteria bacterium]
DFRRIRLGVGRPGDKGKVLSHVLRDFAKADDAWLDPLLAAMAQAAPLLVWDDSDSAFASKVALTLKPPTHKPKPEAPEIIEGEENQSSE